MQAKQQTDRNMRRNVLIRVQSHAAEGRITHTMLLATYIFRRCLSYAAIPNNVTKHTTCGGDGKMHSRGAQNYLIRDIRIAFIVRGSAGALKQARRETRARAFVPFVSYVCGVQRPATDC